ncbi:MAG: polymer-forming cytoskeletal protein [Blastochloris viridis]|uniref:Polymer-forming cytoskeletal protein n=1 Tax=Blastochloris viridis TaxID=1079 RepID=A0A6N4R8E7_BLAVI|nr:MAG: polymer-forming cytoskeletal protein [Blastochloris viridis]
MLWFLGGKKGSSKSESVSLEVVDPRDIDGHCLITGNLQIRGDVYFSGQLRVDGRIDGKVSVFEGGRGQLVVSKGAVINGPIYANTVLVDGTINGPMDVEEKLECRPNAVIRGRVVYGSIHISDGAKIEAQCQQRTTITQTVSVSEDSAFSAPLLATRDVTSKLSE